MLTSRVYTKWHRSGFHPLVHDYFNIHRHHFYEYSSSLAEVKRVTSDLSRNIIYKYNSKSNFINPVSDFVIQNPKNQVLILFLKYFIYTQKENVYEWNLV